MYLYLRTLSFVKTALGYLTTKTAQAYNYVGVAVALGVTREIKKIELSRDKAIVKAKHDVIMAAERVVELEVRVKDVESKETDKAAELIFELKTKVN
jgi:hypothetical protein